MAAVFPPWTRGERAIAQVAQAGGLVVRRGLIDAIVVAPGVYRVVIQREYVPPALSPMGYRRVAD